MEGDPGDVLRSLYVSLLPFVVFPREYVMGAVCEGTTLGPVTTGGDPSLHV